MTLVGSLGVGVVLLFGYVPLWHTLVGLTLITASVVVLSWQTREPIGIDLRHG